MKRVNCLLRVSSKQQLHGDDIPVQREECRAYIEKHSDWQFQKEYLEKAVSGFKTSLKDRDILQEILQDARDKTFDVLVVYMSDRIGRKSDFRDHTEQPWNRNLDSKGRAVKDHRT